MASLENLIAMWESPNLEFKTKTDKNLGKTVSAFANTAGGEILLGIAPNKQIVGLQNADEESRHVREILENCKPQPVVEQQFLRRGEKTVIALDVKPLAADESPCFYESKCYIRQGTTNQELTGPELIQFLRSKALLNFELQRSQAALEDLDIDKLANYFKKRGISQGNLQIEALKTILSGMHVAYYGIEFYLRNVAVMFFAKEPSKFVHSLKVRIVEYKNSDPTPEDIKTDKTKEGTIPQLIDEAFARVKQAAGKQYRLQDTMREETETYPAVALREVITNALGHRDYSSMQPVLIEIFPDRLQVTNPGGLLYGQTLENFDRTPQHRNAVCYELLHDLGYGEGLGLGVKLIRLACRRQSLPDPEFYSLGNMFRVVLYNSRSTRKVRPAEQLNERQKQALEYIKEHHKITSKEYSKVYGVSVPTAISDLNELIRQGKMKKIGTFRGAYYVPE
ncbi:MAG: RNA-binding domain-containing protein [Candidatus Micrarchaeia archaeon]